MQASSLNFLRFSLLTCKMETIIAISLLRLNESIYEKCLAGAMTVQIFNCIVIFN